MTVAHNINPTDDLQKIAADLKAFADSATAQINSSAATLDLGTNAAPTTVAATGSNQGNAAALTLGFNLVTAADATKGVILPTAAAGKECKVVNNAAAILKVYPGTSDAINALAANSAISMAANTSAIFYAYDATTWYTIPTVPS